MVIATRTHRTRRARARIRVRTHVALRSAERGLVSNDAVAPAMGAVADVAAVDGAAEGGAEAGATGPDIVEIWGLDSFPASDAPANW